MPVAEVGAVGFPPVVKVRPTERELYRRMWAHPEYRAVAPGEDCAATFLRHANPKAGSTVIDFGCGTGRGALAIALFGGVDVILVDFASNCLDLEVTQALTTQAHALRFVEADLTKTLPPDLVAPYGYCTDVMEHIPPSLVDRVLDNILQAAQHVFFQIATRPDILGQLEGHELHLTVRPHSWWLEKFQERQCVVHWSADVDGACLFYVTAWATGRNIVDAGTVNTSEDEVLANVRANIAGGWMQATPHVTNDHEVMILGGGPTLNQYVETIRDMRAEGKKLVTLNGSYNWALEHGLTPSAQVMVDARAFNARFVRPAIDDCRYLISSQCHPDALQGLPKDRTYLWHTTTKLIAEELKKAYDVYWAVPGGSTVLLRAIPLLRMLGFRRFHLFGCDSCLSPDEAHHAYSQPENDSPVVVPVTVSSGRIFHCHPWMVAQAQEFIDLLGFLGDEIELEIYGDGMLSHILDAGAIAADLDCILPT